PSSSQRQERESSIAVAHHALCKPAHPSTCAAQRAIRFAPSRQHLSLSAWLQAHADVAPRQSHPPYFPHPQSGCPALLSPSAINQGERYTLRRGGLLGVCILFAVALEAAFAGRLEGAPVARFVEGAALQVPSCSWHAVPMLKDSDPRSNMLQH